MACDRTATFELFQAPLLAIVTGAKGEMMDGVALVWEMGAMAVAQLQDGLETDHGENNFPVFRAVHEPHCAFVLASIKVTATRGVSDEIVPESSSMIVAGSRFGNVDHDYGTASHHYLLSNSHFGHRTRRLSWFTAYRTTTSAIDIFPTAATAPLALGHDEFQLIIRAAIASVLSLSSTYH